MSRENFLIKATNFKDGSAEYIHIGNITRISRTVKVDATEKTKGVDATTIIHMIGGDTVQVSETIEELERKGAAYGVMKMVP